MAVVYLIRHGQASFGSEDYDRLSELGRRQAGLLGAHLKRSGPHVDALLSGGLRRQQDTAAEIATALGERAPEITIRNDFNEYDHIGVIRAYMPLFMTEVGGPRGLEDAQVFSDHKLFEFAFRFMIKSWMDNRPHDNDALESWRDFCGRVSAGLDHVLTAHGPKARVAIVTSGGTIAAALRAVLGLSNKRTLSMNWSIYNASLTQLYYGRSARHEDALLLGFNNVSHLEQSGGRDLITFR
ncbi:MAG TPA: histidine phosphatase family protein [Gammaproteobacteria bacterium]|nr:histidine phosphatase family protein [Gammaproteobacteria bacterium]HRP87437.1 histidine phosphatase family protein [Gammaproteobacteria bacterium]